MTRRRATRAIVQSGVGAAIVGALAVVGVTSAAAAWFDVELATPGLFGGAVRPVSITSAVLFTVVVATVATVARMLLEGRVAPPGATFRLLGLVVLAMSLIPVLQVPDTSLRVLLALVHVVAGLPLIVMLGR